MTAQAWVSGHLFFRGGIYTEACDRVLLEHVRPLIARVRATNLVDRHFFIRYSEHGSHVRLRFRLRSRDAREPLSSLVETELANGGVEPRPEEASTHAPALSWRWVTYEPELVRYGGEVGVRVAEQCFDVSSRAVLGWLDTLAADASLSRLGVGIGAMLSALSAFALTAEQASELSATHAEGCIGVMASGPGRGRAEWRAAFEAGFQRQEDRLRRLVAGCWDGGDIVDFADYDAGLRAVAGRLSEAVARGLVRYRDRPVDSVSHAVRALLPSYMHMTSNRLGVSVPDEAFLSHAIARSLATRAALVAGR